MYVAIQCSGNCNFSYITGLSYGDTPESAMAQVLSLPKDPWTPQKTGVAPGYKAPTCGMYLFAQGSEDNTKTKPYAPAFKAYIESEGLGTVTEHPAKNPLHGWKLGILYVWTVNHEACAAWWKKHVQEPYQKGLTIKKEVK